MTDLSSSSVSVYSKETLFPSVTVCLVSAVCDADGVLVSAACDADRVSVMANTATSTPANNMLPKARYCCIERHLHMSGSQGVIGWKGSQDSEERQATGPRLLNAMCRKPNTDRWPIPLQLGIALASQGLLSYRRGRGDVVVGASLRTVEARTLEPRGGQDASPTARSLCCRSPLDAGHGRRIRSQHRRSESCAS